jgi:hypothetical protein
VQVPICQQIIEPLLIFSIDLAAVLILRLAQIRALHNSLPKVQAVDHQ